MSQRALILAVVVLLIASTVLVLGPAPARASPVTPSASPAAPPRAAVHPGVSVITLQTGYGECYDCNETYYATGSYEYPGYNILYFHITDAADTQATFKIIDPNATRDGLPNPVFQATVTLNATTHDYYSAQHGVSYVFPAGLKMGGGWTVIASGATGGNASYEIHIVTYFLSIGGTPYPGSAVLPGESVTITYEALSMVNGAPISTITNVSYFGRYFGANDTYTNLFPSGIVKAPAAGIGSYTFTVPANATPFTDLFIATWAAIYNGTQMAENESFGSSEYYLGEVWIDYFGMASLDGQCPDGYQSDYTTNSSVQACALIGVVDEGGFYAVPGLSVTIHYWNGQANVTPIGGAPTQLTTNATGWVAWTFWVSNPQFNTYYQYPGYNSINLTVTDPAARPVPSTPYYNAYLNRTFWVYGSAATAGLTVALNQLDYYTGQAITATWTITTSNASVGAVTANLWQVWGSTGMISQGTISGTANSGTLPVTLPTGYVGEFEVDVFASNATTTFEGDAIAYATAPLLYLNPSSTTFTPGSTVTVQAVDYGAAGLTNPVISYQVLVAYGSYISFGGEGAVASGTVANGSSITINVPATGTPFAYEVYAVLTAGGVTIATQSLVILQSWGYNVLVGVSTASSYSDGSYQPGQTLTVTYQIEPYGNAPLPTTYTYEVFLGGTQISSVLSTDSTSGSVQITIPSNWPSGWAQITVRLTGQYLNGNACSIGVCSGMTGVLINAHPAVLSMEIGAGSGLTVGWLILLIIILVVAIVLALMIRRRRTPPSGGQPTTPPMSPAAPAPSQPAATPWQEPSSPSSPPTSDGQPPMPSPPPGAT